MPHPNPSSPRPAGSQLNIGCGNDPWGDVRVDPFREGSANVIADAHYLPFRDNSFSDVRCWHVLEHCRDPRKAATEAKRVGGTVNARFPYKYDRIPWVLSYLSTFRPRVVYGGLREIWIDVATKTIQRHNPLRHLWMVQPVAPSRLNRVPFPGLFVRGRKARILRRLSLDLQAEWECWF